MTLLEIKKFFQSRSQASLLELANYFEVLPNTITPLLLKWLNKGKLKKQVANCKSSCYGCRPSCNEVYIWQDSTPNDA